MNALKMAKGYEAGQENLKLIFMVYIFSVK